MRIGGVRQVEIVVDFGEPLAGLECFMKHGVHPLPMWRYKRSLFLIVGMFSGRHVVLSAETGLGQVVRDGAVGLSSVGPDWSTGGIQGVGPGGCGVSGTRPPMEMLVNKEVIVLQERPRRRGENPQFVSFWLASVSERGYNTPIQWSGMGWSSHPGNCSSFAVFCLTSPKEALDSLFDFV